MDHTIRLVDLIFKKCLSLLINLFYSPKQFPDFDGEKKNTMRNDNK
jgi:hypothetical protein